MDSEDIDTPDPDDMSAPLHHHSVEHFANTWKGLLATVFGAVTGETLEHLNAIAAIFAHVGTGLAGTATAVYTIYWLVKGRRKPGGPS